MAKQTPLSPKDAIAYDAMRLSLGDILISDDAARAALEARVRAAGYVRLANGDWRVPRSAESSPRCPTVSGEIVTP